MCSKLVLVQQKIMSIVLRHLISSSWLYTAGRIKGETIWAQNWSWSSKKLCRFYLDILSVAVDYTQQEGWEVNDMNSKLVLVQQNGMSSVPRHLISSSWLYTAGRINGETLCAQNWSWSSKKVMSSVPRHFISSSWLYTGSNDKRWKNNITCFNQLSSHMVYLSIGGKIS
jgi:hypothetical protein